MSVTASRAAFALSFASVFLVCYIGSQFLSSVLNDAGYDISGTILGYEKQPQNMSSQLIRDFSTNQLAQLVAIALTVATSVFIFLKFSKSELGPVYVHVKYDEVEVRLQGRRNRCWTPRIGKNSHS